MRYFRRPSTVVLVAAGLSILALGAWIATPPSAVDDYARGAPKAWSYLSELRREQPGLSLRRPYVPLSRISLELQLAVMAGEDGGFLGHGTFDTAEIRDALYEWARGGRLRGASTLSQQLAKNLFLSDARSIVRKVREARYAYWLERRLGKRRILELYLNVIELGEGTLGVEAGSMLYFGVPASSLDGQQAAELAAAIPSPLGNNPATRTAAWRTRYAAIRARMRQYGWLRQEILALNGGGPALAGAPRARPAGAAGGAAPGAQRSTAADDGPSASEASEASEATGATGEGGATAGSRTEAAGAATVDPASGADPAVGSPADGDPAAGGLPPAGDGSGAPEPGSVSPPSSESRATPDAARRVVEQHATAAGDDEGSPGPGSTEPE